MTKQELINLLQSDPSPVNTEVCIRPFVTCISLYSVELHNAEITEENWWGCVYRTTNYVNENTRPILVIG